MSLTVISRGVPYMVSRLDGTCSGPCKLPVHCLCLAVTAFNAMMVKHWPRLILILADSTLFENTLFSIYLGRKCVAINPPEQFFQL